MSENLEEWMGRPVLDSAGEKIGEVTDVYLDEDTNSPEWLAVRAEAGTHLVPLISAMPGGDGISVGFTKAQVVESPAVEADELISTKEEGSLYKYYGLQYSEKSDGEQGSDNE